jgi:hypothetical protein
MDKREDAKMFQGGARTAEQRQDEMKNGVLKRMRQSKIGRGLGAVYDSPLAKAVVAGMRDAYRRCFEQAWFQGRDIYDGRWHFDNQVGQQGPWPQSIRGMARNYDQRASFYGLDQKQAQGNGQDRGQVQEYSRER